MPGFRSATQALVVMAVGVIVMVVEGVIVMSGNSLSQINEIVLWVGLGIFTLGGLMVIVATTSNSG